MPTQCLKDALADKENVVVILRLVAGPDGVLSHGEVLDVAGESRGCFNDWAGLVRHLELFLAGNDQEKPP